MESSHHDSAPPLAVFRYNEGSFFVKSEQPRSTQFYLVTLPDAEHPAGMCDCMQHSCRIEPLLCRKQPPIWGAQCKHQKLVAAALAHAQQLCESAGLTFDERIIPSFHD